MTIKKIHIIAIIGVALVLSGCNKTETVPMNKLAADNNYHYENKDLGFAIALPSEFIYYQTQRKNTDDYTDLEIFVPTSDKSYYQEVPGYAKPIVIRIFSKSAWEQVKNEEENIKIYRKISEKDDRVYTLKIWDKIPADWQNKWTDEMGKKIIASFKTL